jgi:hypothetical protein
VISIAAMRTRDLEPEHVWMAAWVEDVAGQYGQVEAIERVAAAMSERVGKDLLSLQWLIRGFLKACEVAESLAEDFLSQRFVSAQAMTRALLEGAATLAWTMDEPTEGEPLLRVHRCLRTSYEERLRKGHLLPEREQTFLDRARNAGLNQRPDVRGMLDMLDRAEEGRGDTAYWASHYKQFGLSSDFLHDPFTGVGVFAIDEEAGMMHVDLNPDVRVGLLALRWGAFYLVRCLDSVLRFAGLDQEADDLARRYAAFKDVGAAALDALTD